MSEPAILTVEEIASAARVTRGAVEKWIKFGVYVSGQKVRLAATRIGGRIRIDRESYAAFISACNPAPVRLETPAAVRRRAAAAEAEARALVNGGGA